MAREQTGRENYRGGSEGAVGEGKKLAILVGIPAATYHWAVDHTNSFAVLHRADKALQRLQDRASFTYARA